MRLELDVDPQRDDDASPMSTYRCMLRPTWTISAPQHKSKYKSNPISNFFEKKNQIFWFPWCSTREDLSIDVSITNVGLILTKLRWFQLFVKCQNSNFELFWKKNQIFGFPWCITREDLSIDVSFTNVGLILTKLRWFQLFVKSQNSNSELYWKKSNFWVSMVYYSWRPFHWCIKYQFRTDIDEAKVISALQHKSKFEFRTFLKKKIKFLGFHSVVLVKTFPLMYQLPM